jgi:hypothetical protein
MKSTTRRTVLSLVAKAALAATATACSGVDVDSQAPPEPPLADTQQPLAGGRHFWARVRGSDGAVTNSYLYSGGTITVNHPAPGEYYLTATGTWYTTMPRGNAQVVAMGMGQERCGFITSPLDDPTGNTHLWIICSLNGVHANSDFAVQYAGAGPNTPTTPAAYFTTEMFPFPTHIDPERTWHSRGATNRVLWSSTGSYQVQLPGLGGSTGAIQISTLLKGSHDGRYCKYYDAGTSTIDKWIGVNCYDKNGVRTDSNFMLNYFSGIPDPGKEGQVGSVNHGAYVFADRHKEPTYVPSNPSSWIGPGVCGSAQPSRNNVIRNGPGVYTVQHFGFPAHQATAHVTAVGTSSKLCKIESIVDAPGIYCTSNVNIRCFTATGTPADLQFYESFMTP